MGVVFLVGEGEYWTPSRSDHESVPELYLAALKHRSVQPGPLSRSLAPWHEGSGIPSSSDYFINIAVHPGGD